MHGWLAVLNLLPSHLLLPQLGLSSRMSPARLLSDVFPVTLFPEPATRCKPLLVLLLVVLAWISLLLPPPNTPTAIPPRPPPSLAVLLTIVLLLLFTSTIESFTSLRTQRKML